MDKRPLSMFFHVHLVSDSTGETLVEVMRASCAQFSNISPIEHIHALVRTEERMERALKSIEDNPGIVFYTLVDTSLRHRLEETCQSLGVKAVAILDPILAGLARYLGVGMTQRVGAQHVMDTQYFERIEALDYALAHDDGHGTHRLYGADIVLIGVSRTSKTPTCIYLAHRGYKAANIPLTGYESLPDLLFQPHGPFVAGLVASPERLVQIRKNRLLALQEHKVTDYVDEEKIKQEVKDTKRLCHRHGWPVLDVTRRSIEETSAKIIMLFNRRKMKNRDQTTAHSGI